MNTVLLGSLIALMILMIAAIVFAFICIRKVFCDIQLVNERIDFIVRYSQMTDAERELMSNMVDNSLNAYRPFWKI